MNHQQLADLIRPKNFDEIVGQSHLFGHGGVIRKMLSLGRITNMIFYGPPGTGKTTAARVIAEQSGMHFYQLNATTASLTDVKEVLNQTATLFGQEGILLYLDEIQYFNRKQQQTLLEYIEDGRVTLIASTTENPHFYVYNAILSRSALFEFRPVKPEEMLPTLRRALNYLNESHGLNVKVKDSVLTFIGKAAKGDVRHGLVLFENAYYAADDEITEEHVTAFDSNVVNFNDDTHYDLMSCLQKSIRGSDPDAAIFYLAKLLTTGDLISACRRLQVIASEDIGPAYPMAAVITRACCESAIELGLPEAEIPLANATVVLATAPKSNSSNEAIKAARADAEAGKGLVVPEYLQSPLFKGYKYPHAYPNHYVEQSYLPEDLKDKKYYVYGTNKTENAAKEYWDNIKNKK